MAASMVSPLTIVEEDEDFELQVVFQTDPSLILSAAKLSIYFLGVQHTKRSPRHEPVTAKTDTLGSSHEIGITPAKAPAIS